MIHWSIVTDLTFKFSTLNLNSSGGSSHSSSEQSSSSWARQLRERNDERDRRKGRRGASVAADAVVHVEVFDDSSQPSDKGSTSTSVSDIRNVVCSVKHIEVKKEGLVEFSTQ